MIHSDTYRPFQILMRYQLTFIPVPSPEIFQTMSTPLTTPDPYYVGDTDPRCTLPLQHMYNAVYLNPTYAWEVFVVLGGLAGRWAGLYWRVWCDTNVGAVISLMDFPWLIGVGKHLLIPNNIISIRILIDSLHMGSSSYCQTEGLFGHILPPISFR